MSRLTLVILATATLFPTEALCAAEFTLGTPTNLGPDINTSLTESSPAISPDGLTLYYGSSPAPNGYHTAVPADLWFSTRPSIDAPWEPGTVLDLPTDSPASLWTVSISADSLSLYFSDGVTPVWSHGEVPLPGGEGRSDIWVSTRESPDADWQEPANLGPTINSAWHDTSPTISADGRELYFVSRRPGGIGNDDIWVSRLQDNGEWGEPENLGPLVNSSLPEWSPNITPDGLTLFFTSELRPDGVSQWPDIYVTTRDSLDSPWREAVNLGRPLNSSLADRDLRLSYDGSELYFSRFTPPGSGQFDLFSVSVTPLENAAIVPGSEPYTQAFDEAFGVDGSVNGMSFPKGWTTSENGVVHQNEIMQRFPVNRSISSQTPPTFNAGAENDSDRALAIGVAIDSDQPMLQFLAAVTSSDATALELKFDVEAWDSRPTRVDLPGEAAFDVTLEADTGDGFTQLVEFGRVTTGAVLLPSATGDYVDGNLDANRVTFDSGILPADIPADSRIRVRWRVPIESESTGWVFGLDNVELNLLGALRAGDSNQDYEFDQADLVQVLTAAKYLTGQPATWGEGDWNGAPGGYPGSAPPGDGVFNQMDIIAAQQGAAYLAGRYGVLGPGGIEGDSQTSLIYNAGTGELSVDAPVGVDLTSINIDSAAGIFTGEAAANLGGSFDNDAGTNIFKATFGSSFGSLSFGKVAQPGLSEEFVLGDLTVIGSLAGGGELGNVDLVYVPEPASVLLLSVGVLMGLLHFGWVRR